MSTTLKTFFISDLHLSNKTQQVTLLFDYFLQKIIKPQDTLFILGDFFEYYLGEDLLDEVQIEALSKLKLLQEQGSKIFFIHGNRDFLIHSGTLSQYGIQLLKDPSLVELYGKRLLISHGDLLCTDDRPYQRYKKIATHPFTRWLFLHLPRAWRSWLAEKIHSQNPHKAFAENPGYTLADATPFAIEHALETYHPDFFIYGHVHRMGTYQHGKITRMVLGDWYHNGNYIEIAANQIGAKVFSVTDSLHSS